MQFVVMGVCLALLFWQAINFRMLGKQAVPWEVVYVLGIVCECCGDAVRPW
jgi:hypothetical protein